MTIHTLTVDKVPNGYHIHGCTSLGPVSRVGATRDEAIALAKIQLCQMQRAYWDKRYPECVEQKPDYFQGKRA